MKVTVCFGLVRVVVPCGDGNGTVRDLMIQAATRYSKVSHGGTGWGNDSWVTVHSLKSSDGGLLDPDDRLSDVVDDREHISAVYEEKTCDGTPSPAPAVTVTQNGDHAPQPCSRVDIEFSGDQDIEVSRDQRLDHTCLLEVRRGSEPALNQLGPLPQSVPTISLGDTSKRWSAAPIIDDHVQTQPVKAASCDALSPPAGERGEPVGDDRDHLTLPRLTRDSNRLSVQILGNSQAMWRWADAADRALSSRESRSEPVGGASDSPGGSANAESYGDRVVVLSNVTGPLGIHVVPDRAAASGGGGGVLVQRVDPGGAVAEDGRVVVGDRISHINGHCLAGCDLQRAQEVFSAALSRGELVLRLSARHGGGHTPTDADDDNDDKGRRVAAVQPTKKVAASLGSRTQSVMLTSNTRKLGRRLRLKLSKGGAGLGFSVTTRDNPAGGHAPVYVKTILPKGAAVEDGRLRPGDRLLEIDGVEVTGLCQQRVVQLLRAVPPGQTVALHISRHDHADEDDAHKTQPATVSTASGLPPKTAASVTTITSDVVDGAATCDTALAGGLGPDQELLVLQVAVGEEDTTGLGVSVKGRASHGADDAGIFVKSVLPGGAASRHGRLQPQDQLVNINGCPLLGLTNAQAMEVLKAQLETLSRPGSVVLTVARLKDLAASTPNTDAGSTVNSAGEMRPSAPPAAAHPTVTITHQRAPQDPTPPPGRNPVLDRLTGRNDSYYLATHDSWSGGSEPTPPPAPLAPQPAPPAGGGVVLACPTVNMPSGDTVVIETDPAPASLSSQHSEADVAYASQTSLDTTGGGFTRDQLGRQSISEKRHASKDAKSTDTYQRTKRAREEREAARRRIEAELDLEAGRPHAQPGGVVAEAGRSGSQQLLSDPEPTGLPPSEVGPSLGMKKSSSLESLQTMVQQALSEDVEPSYPRPGAAKVVRGRGCNESFRAAVDRSYEAPLDDDPALMETVDEEAAAAEAELFSRGRAARQSSLSSGAAEGKKTKGRRSGLLRGLGSMFRFGKHRKVSDPPALSPRLTPEELLQQQEQLNRVAARRRAEDDQRRQQQQQQHRAAPPPPERSASRPERIQQLREQHQRRHASRQGQHRSDAAPDCRSDPQHGQEAEPGKPPVPAPPEQLSDRINNNVPERAAFWRAAPLAGGVRSSEYFRNHRPAPLSAAERALFWRSEQTGWRSPDPYETARRAGCRSAQADAWYGHYGGYGEMHHMPRRQQQLYHSQRGGRPEPPRPLGSFYEYESVQALMRLGGGEKYSNRSLPRLHERRQAAMPPPPHGMKHAVSVAACGVRRGQPLGIPSAPLGMPYTRRGSEGMLRGPHRPPPPPPPLSPPGSRV